MTAAMAGGQTDPTPAGSSTTAAAQTGSATTTTAAQTTPTTTAAAATPCTDQPMNHKIDVTAEGVSCKDAHVSKKQQNTIRWTSPKGTTLSIVWDTKIPFHSLSCRGNTCKAKGVKNLDDGSILGYVAAIDGVKTKDPNVIINP